MTGRGKRNQETFYLLIDVKIFDFVVPIISQYYDDNFCWANQRGHKTLLLSYTILYSQR